MLTFFGSEKKIMQYLDRWADKDSGNPLYSLSSQLQFLAARSNGQSIIDDINLKDWSDAVMKCGPKMLELLKLAKNMPSPEKTDDGRTWSFSNTRKKLAEKAYARSAENIALSIFCFEHKTTEQNFNKALDLIQQQTATVGINIPQITIDGSVFGIEGAKFHRLAANDIRGLFLGDITNCCQKIGGAGEKCAVQGFTSEDGGFYVIEKDDGEIIAQAWTWRGNKGELVFDSLETLGERVTREQWEKLLKAFATELEKQPGNVTALNVGWSGYAGTRKDLSKAFNEAAQPAIPTDHPPYYDSTRQLNIWSKKSRQPKQAKAA